MRLTFVKKQLEVGNVESFFFSSEDLTDWVPGQYVNLTMPDIAPVYADRIFTIASAPHEGIIQITTIIGPSPFKQRMDQLKPGEIIEADQLGGDFTWDIPTYVNETFPESVAKNPKRLFIAGGIGITPYISIIRDRQNKGESLSATLLYAGKPEGRPFVKELQVAAQQNLGLIVKDYVTTRLTLQQLQSDFPDIDEYIVYLAGSQTFSETLGKGLIEQGFPRNQIKYDYFDGYTTLEY